MEKDNLGWKGLSMRDKRKAMGIKLTGNQKPWDGRCSLCKEHRGMYHDCPEWTKDNFFPANFMFSVIGWEWNHKDGNWILEKIVAESQK